MARHWFVLGACTLLGAVVILMSGNSAAAPTADEIADAQKKVLGIADDIANKKNDDAKKKAADAIKKLQINDYKDLEASMTIMADKDKGGIGFGGGKFGKPDGIWPKVINLTRKPLTAKEADAQADELTKSANIILAVSEMATLKTPKAPADKAKWDKWVQDMKDSASALADAAGKKDPDAIKAAAIKLDTTCTDCHNVFKKK